MVCGLRLYVKNEHSTAVRLPFHTTTELAAPFIHAFQVPAGVKAMVLCDAYDRCRTVVQACREPGCHFASTLQSHRRLCQQGWRRKAGRDGKHLFRRRRPTPFVIDKPQGQIHDRRVDAGLLQVSTLGLLPVVFSRTGGTRTILGLVTDALELSAAGLIRTYETRWVVELFFKDSQPRLGLGQYQNRSWGAEVIHRPLVCLADALPS